MWDSINYRAILPVACAVTGFVIACCLLLYSFIKSDLVQMEVRHATDLADTVVKSTRYAMLHDDRETLRNIIASLEDLGHLGSRRQGEARRPCHLFDCPRLEALTEALNQTIDVLEKTKGSFKSKELGQLRVKLEEVVAKHGR